MPAPPTEAPEPIAVIGMSCYAPGGVENPTQLYDFLASHGDGLVPIPATRWNADETYSKTAGIPGKGPVRYASLLQRSIYNIDTAPFGLAPREAEQLDPQQRLLLESTWHALEDAGIPPLSLGGKTCPSTGVYMGSFIMDSQTLAQSVAIHAAQSHFNPSAHGATMVSARVAYMLNLHGPTVSVDTACSSSLVAITLAADGLRAGKCDIAISGGANAILAPSTTLSMAKGGFLSKDGRSKTFEATADGYGRGEGVGIVVLKRLSDAIRDNDGVYAVILNAGTNSDGRTDTMPMPSQFAQAKLAAQVVAEAGVNPADVEFVECHGTGTGIGDPIELGALGQVYGRAPDRGLSEENDEVQVTSIKSNVGHMEAASGVLGFIKAVIMVQERIALPLRSLNKPNPAIPFRALGVEPTVRQKVLRGVKRMVGGKEVRQVLGAVNSFGYGGSNAHVLVGTVPDAWSRCPVSEQKSAVASIRKHKAGVGRVVAKTGDGAQGVWYLPVTGGCQGGLRNVAKQLVGVLEGEEVEGVGGEEFLARLCYNMCFNRSIQAERGIVVGQDLAEVLGGLKSLANGAQAGVGVVAAAMTVDEGEGGAAKEFPGVVIGQAKTSGTVWVFTGMGPQSWRMGSELYARDVNFARGVNDVDRYFKPLSGWSIKDVMLSEEEGGKSMNTHKVGMIGNLAIQVGLVYFLRSKGVTPSAIIGHSVGEVAAAWAADCITLSEAVLLLYKRNVVQSSLVDQGTMLAIGMGAPQAHELLEPYNTGEDGQQVSIAAINAPDSVTLAGPLPVLQKIKAQLQEQELFAALVRVQVPYHSHMMAPHKAKILEACSAPFLSADPSAPAPTKTAIMNLQREGPRQLQPLAIMAGLIPSIQSYVAFMIYIVQQIIGMDRGTTMASRQVSTVSQTRPRDNKGAVTKSESAQKGLSAPSVPLFSTTFGRRIAKKSEVRAPEYWVRNAMQPVLLQDAILACADGGWRDLFMEIGPHPVLKGAILSTLSSAKITGSTVVHCLKRSVGEYPTAHAAVAKVWVAGGELDWDKLLPEYGRRFMDLPLYPFQHAEEGVVDELVKSGQTGDAVSSNKNAAASVYSKSQFSKLLMPNDIRRGTFVVRELEGTENKAYTCDLRHVALKYLTQHRAEGTPLLPASAHVDAMLNAILAGRAGESVYTSGKQEDGARQLLAGLRHVQFMQPLTLLEDDGSAQTMKTMVDKYGEAGVYMEASGKVNIPYAQYSGGHTISEIDLKFKLRDSVDVEASEKLLREQPMELKNEEIYAEFEAKGMQYGPQFQRILRAAKMPESDTLVVELINDTSRVVDNTTDLDPPPYDIPGYDRPLNDHGQYAVHPGTLDCAFQAAALLCEKDPSINALPASIDHVILHDIVPSTLPTILAHVSAKQSPNDITMDITLFHPTTGAPFLEIHTLTMKQVPRSIAADLFTHEKWSIYTPTTSPPPPQPKPFRIIGDETHPAVAALRSTPDQWVEVAPAVPAWKDDERSVFQYGELVITENGQQSAADRLYVGQDPEALKKLKEEYRERAREVMLRTADESAVEVEGVAEQGLVSMYEEKEQGEAVEVFFVADSEKGALDGEGSDPLGRELALQVLAAARSMLGKNEILTLITSNAIEATGDEGEVEPRLAAIWGLCRSLRSESPDLKVRLVDVVIDMPRQGDEVPAPVVDGSPGVVIVKHNWEGWANDAKKGVMDLGTTVQQKRNSMGDRVMVEEGSEKLPSREMSVTERTGSEGSGGEDGEMVGADISTQLDSTSNATSGSVKDESSQEADTDVDQTVGGLGSFLMRNEGDWEERAWRWGNVYQCEILLGQGEVEYETEYRTMKEGERFYSSVPLAGNVRSAVYRPAGPPPRVSDSQVEIQIEIASLNWKDIVKIASFLLSTDYASQLGSGVGLEAYGEVTRVGKDIEDLKPGDKVYFADREGTGSVGSHVVVERYKVLKRLDGEDIEACAKAATGHVEGRVGAEDGSSTLLNSSLLTFTTAAYSVFEAGKLQKGERILIHSATGGVGSAAVKLAQHTGAVIFATAGSEAKRNLLRQQGIEYVYDSRTLDFGPQIRKDLGGSGVDVVVNSLPGEGLKVSMELLNPFGRFVEIGMRDTYDELASLQMKMFKYCISFSTLDFSIEKEDLNNNPLTQTFLKYKHLLQLVEDQAFTVYPAHMLSQALESISKAQHVGKIVMDMRTAYTTPIPISQQLTRDSFISPNKTYLITGGTTGLGLWTAKNLVHRGARHLMLASRRGAYPDEASATVGEALTRLGASVQLVAMDVADYASVVRAVAEIPSSAPLDGVFHSAAQMHDVGLEQLTGEALDTVLQTKARGALNLHLATKEKDLTFFVVYSSVAGIVGMDYQLAYCQSNIFMEGLVRARRARGLSGTAIHLGRVDGVGMAQRLWQKHGDDVNTSLNGVGIVGTGQNEVLDGVFKVLLSGVVHPPAVVVGRTLYGLWIDTHQMVGWSRLAGVSKAMGRGRTVAPMEAARQKVREELEGLEGGERLQKATEIVIRVVAEVLGVAEEQLSGSSNLKGFGLDSLSMVEMRRQLQAKAGMQISPMDLMAAGNEGIEYFAKMLVNQLESGVSEEEEGEDRGDVGEGKEEEEEGEVNWQNMDAVALREYVMARTADKPPYFRLSACSYDGEWFSCQCVTTKFGEEGVEYDEGADLNAPLVLAPPTKKEDGPASSMEFARHLAHTSQGAIIMSGSFGGACRYYLFSQQHYSNEVDALAKPENYARGIVLRSKVKSVDLDYHLAETDSVAVGLTSEGKEVVLVRVWTKYQCVPTEQFDVIFQERRLPGSGLNQGIDPYTQVAKQGYIGAHSLYLEFMTDNMVSRTLGTFTPQDVPGHFPYYGAMPLTLQNKMITEQSSTSGLFTLTLKWTKSDGYKLIWAGQEVEYQMRIMKVTDKEVTICQQALVDGEVMNRYMLGFERCKEKEWFWQSKFFSDWQKKWGK